MAETAEAVETFSINDETITETAVHLYATVRLRVSIQPTADPAEAYRKALAQTDLSKDFRYGEFTDEITSVLVDQISGSYSEGSFNYEDEISLDADGRRDYGHESGRFIVLSTGHVTEADSRILNNLDAQTAPVMVAQAGYGWLISLVPASEFPEERMQELRGLGLSESFVKLWAGMRDRGYGLLHLDCDGDAHSEFETFSW